MRVLELSGDQARQLINAEQVYAAYRAARLERVQRFRGSMSWKSVKGRSYLYRKVQGRWKSLGPRDAEREHIYDTFQAGRAASKARVAELDDAVRRMAPVNRAMGLGRVPWVAARLLRRLDRDALLGHGISVVGTHALFAYERLAGGHLASSDLATGDIDLLLDARRNLRLLAAETRERGLHGILQTTDKSFAPVAPGSFRAVNAEGFMVDLIKPIPAARTALSEPSRIGSAPSDLTAAEIEGLQWLENSPKIEVTVLDERGYPLQIVAPDPRAFALHKLWVAERADRDPLKRRRDRDQALLVTALVSHYCPHMPFDDAALAALPEHLRTRAPELLAAAGMLRPFRASSPW